MDYVNNNQLSISAMNAHTGNESILFSKVILNDIIWSLQTEVEINLCLITWMITLLL